MPTRNFDRESGMNRVSRKKKTRALAPLTSDSEESLADSDSDLEADLDMPAKTDSRRKTVRVPVRARQSDKDGRTPAIRGAEDKSEGLALSKSKEADTKVAPHMAIMSAATYHLGLSIISRPTVSSYIPSCFNMFSMLDDMNVILAHNSILHQMCPEFFSPVINLYYGHVFYYQVLRARAAAGSDVLTRVEKRALTYYERVSPPEGWPVAAPLMGFLTYLASHKPADPMYSWIVPALPDFSKFGAEDGLNSLPTVPGSSRVPLIPALQKLLYNFGNDIAIFNTSSLFLPVGQAAADATHQFCGISTSAANQNQFRILVGNFAWFSPPETGDTIGCFDFSVKRSRIRRWSVPDVPDNSGFQTLSNFLGFNDNTSFDWMKHLLTTASIYNRFFPGSSNLSQISPVTTLGMATQIQYRRTTACSATTDTWFYPRNNLTLSTRGYSTTEDGLLDTKMAITASWNASYSADTKAVRPGTALSFDSLRSGPFFNDDDIHTVTERMATIYTENYNQIDPARRFAELVSRYYDNRGGRN